MKLLKMIFIPIDGVLSRAFAAAGALAAVQFPNFVVHYMQRLGGHIDELRRMVDSGRAEVAFSLYPTSIGELMAVADAGDIMPPKSTWFEPKLRDGIVIHTLD